MGKPLFIIHYTWTFCRTNPSQLRGGNITKKSMLYICDSVFQQCIFSIFVYSKWFTTFTCLRNDAKPCMRMVWLTKCFNLRESSGRQPFAQAQLCVRLNVCERKCENVVVNELYGFLISNWRMVECVIKYDSLRLSRQPCLKKNTGIVWVLF